MYYIQIYIGSDVQLQPIRIKVGLHLKKDIDRRNVSTYINVLPIALNATIDGNT
jgi:hypothetical protein